MKKAVLFWVLIAMFASVACSKFGKVMKSNDFEYKLKMANQYYEKKKYRQAQTLYEELFPLYKGTAQFDDLYYRYAYCHYYQKDYVNAENLFKGYMEVFPNSQRAEEIEYMQALSFYRQSPRPELDQDNTIKAMGMMQIYLNTHPGSPRTKEAEGIIDECAAKLEEKERLSAQLYFNMGQFRAAALAFSGLINNFPYSEKASDYKLMIIKSYYEYAKLSVIEKQPARYEKVITEAQDFQDRFPESKLLKDAERYLTLSQNKIKGLSQ